MMGCSFCLCVVILDIMPILVVAGAAGGKKQRVQFWELPEEKQRELVLIATKKTVFNPSTDNAGTKDVQVRLCRSTNSNMLRLVRLDFGCTVDRWMPQLLTSPASIMSVLVVF